MTVAEIFSQYLQHLFSGRRAEAREVLMAAQDRGVAASKIIKSIIWPAMEQIDKLYREHQISRITEHMATRINRTMADQLQSLMARKPKNGSRVIVTCGDGQIEELGAQMTADLFEAEGYSVWFLGSGVPNDEILQLVGKLTPDFLVIYGTQPEGVPNVRKLVDLIRGVGVCEDMQIMVTGGVFNRAEGLDEEVKADLFAPSAQDAVQLAEDHPLRVPRPDVPQPGRRRKRKARLNTKLRVPEKSETTAG
jgi:methanogenic corrinoid protein MtbC1